MDDPRNRHLDEVPQAPRGRVLAGIDVNVPLTKGHQMRALVDSPYITREGEAFARRRFAKVRGKAAVKAAKRARQAAHNNQQRRGD